MKNKTKIRIKGALRTYLHTSVYLGIFLAIINLFIYLLDYRSGLALSCFVLVYFGITLYLYLRNKSVVLIIIYLLNEYNQVLALLILLFLN